jgi:hypothetical protein
VKAGSDSVLTDLDELLAGRIGTPLEEQDREAAIKEAERRRIARIPPGYADGDKGDPESRAGDYLVWRQLLNEAKLHNTPILFVSDDTKEDWVRLGSRNENLGPRPELVLEMQTEAGVRLHTSTVVGLLADAPRYLGSEVSKSTIQEAEALPSTIRVTNLLERRAMTDYERMSGADQEAFLNAAAGVGGWLSQGRGPLDHPSVGEARNPKGSYLLRWSDRGRAVFTVTPGFGGLDLRWLYLTFKRPDSDGSTQPPVVAGDSSEYSGSVDDRE